MRFRVQDLVEGATYEGTSGRVRRIVEIGEAGKPSRIKPGSTWSWNGIAYIAVTGGGQVVKGGLAYCEASTFAKWAKKVLEDA